MRSYWLLALATLLFVASGLVFTSPGEAQMGYGMHRGMYGGGYGGNQGGGWSYCPYCGRPLQGGGGYPMGPGMMGPGYGPQGMGPGMMGPGYGSPHDYQQGRGYRRYNEPLKKEDARKEVEDMLKESGNPNLKLGDVEEDGRYYVVGILTKDGSLVDKMKVDKDTGMMRSMYGR